MKLFNKRNQKGFTLVEMMSVTAIVAMMTAMSAPHFLGMKISANEGAAQASLRSLQTVMEDYRFANGSYPSSGAQLTSFVNSYYGSQSILSNIDSDTWVFEGYRYTYYQFNASSWEWLATPRVDNITGNRVFLLTEAGFLNGSSSTQSDSQTTGGGRPSNSSIGTGDGGRTDVTFDPEGRIITLTHLTPAGTHIIFGSTSSHTNVVLETVE